MAMQRLREAAEKAKCELSSSMQVFMKIGYFPGEINVCNFVCASRAMMFHFSSSVLYFCTKW